MTLPAPIIHEHAGFLVVRDDLLPGGTKRRAMHTLFDERSDYVYASPVYGHAQIALAHACHDYGKRALVFCAQRKTRYPLTQQAEIAGAIIHEVPMGFLTVVQARCREYCEQHPEAKLLPFGLDDPTFILALADVARALACDADRGLVDIIERRVNACAAARVARCDVLRRARRRRA